MTKNLQNVKILGLYVIEKGQAEIYLSWENNGFSHANTWLDPRPLLEDNILGGGYMHKPRRQKRRREIMPFIILFDFNFMRL